MGKKGRCTRSPVATGLMIFSSEMRSYDPGACNEFILGNCGVEVLKKSYWICLKVEYKIIYTHIL